MKKFLISLIGLLLVPSMAFALSGYEQDNSVRVTAGSQLVIAGSGVYLGCDFMGTSADDEVAIVDAATLVLGQAVLSTSNKILLDKRTPTAKESISDVSVGVPFYDGLVVLVTDSDVDGVVRYKLNP